MPFNQEAIFLIEGGFKDSEMLFNVDEQSESSSQVNMLMIRCLTESLPETRLHRLLHKKQFDEAEKFAKLFHLDMEPVYKSKAIFMLNQASLVGEEDSGAETSRCDDLITCLENISDVAFVFNLCSTASMPTYEGIAKLLQYARGRLAKMKGKGEMESQIQLFLAKIVEILHRLATYGLVYGSNQYTSSMWEAFLNGDMVNELRCHLTQANLARASLVWNRYKETFEKLMSTDLLENLLRSIPGDAPSHDIIPWLRDDIIPFVCEGFPQGKKFIICWIEERAVCLEVTEKAQWPGNGLELAELMLRSSNPKSCGSSSGISDAYLLSELNDSDCTESMKRLKELVHSLKELKQLHSRYRCYLTLDQFHNESTESISFRMLERVAAPELVPGVIAKNISPYAKDHNLEVNALLLNYIKDLLSDTSHHLLAVYEASWEAKAITVIRCISDLQSHCQAILLLMEKAPVPWSRGMEQLVQHGLSLKHPMVTSLQEHFQLVELRDMFLRYDLRSATLGDSDSVKIAVQHILSQNEPSVLEDALRVVKAQPYDLSAIDVYLFRLQHLIKTNQIDQCLSLLTSLSDTEEILCLSRILSWTELVMNDPADRFSDLESKGLRQLTGQALIHLLETQRKKELHMNDAEKALSHRLQEDTQNILHLQMEYDLILPLSCYKDKDFRTQLLKKHVIEYYKAKKSGVRGHEQPCLDERKAGELQAGNFIRVLRLGELLGVSAKELQGQVAVEAAKLGEIANAMHLCRELSEPDCSSEVAYTLYKVSHTVCSQWLQDHGSPTSLSCSDLIKNLHSLMQKACSSCHPDLLPDCLDLCTRLQSMRRISDQCEHGDYDFSVQLGGVESKKDPYQEYTMEAFFKEDSLVLNSQEAIPLVAHMTMACQPTYRPLEAPPLQQARVAGQSVMVVESKESDEKDLDETQVSHVTSIGQSTNLLYQYLREHNQCELAFHVIMESLASSLVHLAANNLPNPQENQVSCSSIRRDIQKTAQMVQLAKQSITDLAAALLNKIFSCKNVDKFQALCFLSILPAKVAVDQIKKLVYNAGQNYQRIIAIALVGCELAKLNADSRMLGVFQQLNTNACWGDRLLKIKISFKEAFNSAEKKRLLLPQLITHPQTGLDLITDYCRDFNMDEKQALLMYIRLLLFPDDSMPEGGHSTQPKSLDEKVIMSAATMCMSTRSSALFTMLKENLDKIDCYDYERLQIVLKIIKMSGLDLTDQTQSTQVGLELLDYLNTYRRTKPPSDYELSFQQSQEEEGGMLSSKPLSPLSKTRLPFHPLIKGGQWKILSRELHEDTVEQILPIAELLKLSTDQLYVTAIQNIIKTHQQAQRDLTSGGQDQCNPIQMSRRVDLDTLNTVKNLLLKVQHPEMAVATARFIAKELPSGKEKVMALKICVLLAQRWKALCEEGTAENQKASTMHKRLTVEHRAVSTEEILHRHGLAELPYTQMIATPAKLIFALYEHSSIESRMQGYQLDAPDINCAADEIAQINNCNLDRIRAQLVEKWIPQPVDDKQDETTMNFSFGSLAEDEISEGEQSLMRLKYLLQSEKKENTVLFLLSVAFKESSTHMTTGCQIRALRCLFSLADDKLIETASNRKMADLRDYLKNLVYVREFEALNVAMDLSTFTSSNKEGLVKGLWRNHNHEPRSIRLIANLCLEYKVHDKNLWNSILQQLQKFGLLAYLQYVLGEIAGLVELRSIQCLPRVWSAVLTTPFTSVCPPLSEEQACRCREVLVLLHRCPVLFDLDLVRLSCQFIRVEMYAEALACLLHTLDKTKRESQIKTLLDSHLVTILNSLMALKERKEPLHEHDQVLSVVYRHIAGTECYELLLGTPHFLSLVHFLAKQDQLEGLVRETLKSNRISDAVKLVNVFHCYYPQSPAIQSVHTNRSADVELLHAYLRAHGLEEEARNLENLVESSEPEL
ncbi:kinetochore-associated protein 1-like [Diadema antillarum]|uniref:kinetochore-associated protein 1-like n=1 Tax=Diadema antillarum TaxID=105358 RepID=UPI003A84B15E